jgi:hypothetical protein
LATVTKYTPLLKLSMFNWALAPFIVEFIICWPETEEIVMLAFLKLALLVFIFNKSVAGFG